MTDLAVVTGAGRGIGRAAALAFARRRVAVALLGNPGERLEQAVAEVRALGVAGQAFACDVSNAAGWSAPPARYCADARRPAPSSTTRASSGAGA